MHRGDMRDSSTLKDLHAPKRGSPTQSQLRSHPGWLQGATSGFGHRGILFYNVKRMKDILAVFAEREAGYTAQHAIKDRKERRNSRDPATELHPRIRPSHHPARAS
ncbi:uncharacterized protein UTRI_00968 [Ustilago trichophora]|uniref:Uncharacterized protein n=1 Tax=Ustilago trichophora TaxID=86804 RepID=A0A5C3DX96_9BASI|nr:uncharacterized protein UTRI_00968 [Ustilago trichophora]